MTQDPKLLEHNYDGIQEFDNPLPNWWLTTFFATIIFAFIYFIHFTYGGGPTGLDELAVETSELPKSSITKWDEAELRQLLQDPARKMRGQTAFAAKCSACHASEGQGLIGPNLTDRMWIHGHGKRADIAEVVAAGVIEKGMPAWEAMMSRDELIDVIAFVYSLRDTNPKNPKAAEGSNNYEVHD